MNEAYMNLENEIPSTNEYSRLGDFWPEIRYMNHFFDVSSLAGEFERCFTRMRVPSRTKLLTVGQVCNNVYFIEHGLLRAYYYRGDHEINLWLLHEAQFVTAIRSFNQQISAYEIIETVEPCILAAIDYNDIMHLVYKSHEFCICVFKIYAYLDTGRDIRNYMFRAFTVEERFRQILILDAPLVNRVSMKMLAAYLEMTPETLCRIMHGKEFKDLDYDNLTIENIESISKGLRVSGKAD
jgi:hypothetical protein